jgi:hypothetical protein
MYTLMSRCKKAGQKRSIKIGNRSFEDVTKFKYLETTLTEQNWMNEEIKERTKFGECLLPFGPESSRLLSRYIKDKYIKKHNSASSFVWV